METNSLLMALGLALFGSGADKATPSISTETYITSTDSHCKVHNPYPQPNETVTWSGQCVNGFANGKGTVQWYQNGKKTDVFVGNFYNGKMHGKGKVVYANGGFYEGDYFNGNLHGKGKMTWENGITYQGDWKNGKTHGKGKLILPNGDIFEGNFINNKINGKGKYIWANGSTYIGGYKNDEKNGYGKLTLQRSNTIIDRLKIENTGHWQGDVYIVQGIFKDGTLKIECSSPTECKKKQANQK